MLPTNSLKSAAVQAADRTLMAWIRTCLSLIGFGFGIAKLRDILMRREDAPRPRTLSLHLDFRAEFYTPLASSASSLRWSNIGEFCSISSMIISNIPASGHW